MVKYMANGNQQIINRQKPENFYLMGCIKFIYDDCENYDDEEVNKILELVSIYDNILDEEKSKYKDRKDGKYKFVKAATKK